VKNKRTSKSSTLIEVCGYIKGLTCKKGKATIISLVKVSTLHGLDRCR